MTAKEFNLLMSLILSMLEKGETDEVIKLIKKSMDDEKTKKE